MTIDEEQKRVFMTQQEFDELLEYSASLPTGTTVGKRWKRNTKFRVPYAQPYWIMGEYVMDDDVPKGHVGIRWRDIVIGKMEDALDFQI